MFLDIKKTCDIIIAWPDEMHEYSGAYHGVLGLYQDSIILWSDHYGQMPGGIYVDTTFYRMDRDGTAHEIVTVKASSGDRMYHDGIIFVGGYVSGHLSQFYDVFGNLIADYADYILLDGYGLENCYKFIDGYAAIIIHGVDSKTYLEIIDKTGSCAFEPITLSSTIGISMIASGKVACYVDDTLVWVDAEGNVTEPPTFYDEYSQRNMPLYFTAAMRYTIIKSST